jgi:transmembrane sensor
MSALQRPIKRELRDATSPASVARMWSRIEARTLSALPRRRFAKAWLIAAAAIFVIGVTFAVLRGRAGTSNAEAILDAHGAPLRALHATSGESTELLSDGSTLTLFGATDVDVLDNSASAVVLQQHRGKVLYDIRPGGPRRWTIECGLATVEVIGTEFRVDRSDTGIHVEVSRGVVLVRGERVPDRAARLTAGMSLDVPLSPTGAVSAPTAESTAIASAVPSVEPSTREDAPPAPANEEPSWKALAKHGESAKAYTELGPGGVARVARAASVDELLLLADVARLSGHAGEAVMPLERIISTYPKSAQAPLAAFTLGKIQLGGSPSAAAATFERAIALGLPGGLAEDAYARLIEARSRAGDKAGAEAAYQRYMARFPSSRRAAELKRWLGTP